jgi:hypothetical protein
VKVCIIGAGSSGIASAKVLADRGIDFDCFEKGSGIGGNWRYDNDNGMSSAYASLHINTSKTLMQYSDYPMPERYPDYPGHAEIMEYFESYVDHFRLRDRISFETEVLDVAPRSGGGFTVTIRTKEGAEELRDYRAVLVANGHHWDARWPDFPGALDDSVEVMHSHDYRTPHGLVGKRVLVVGIGNSAVDIACEACHVAERTVISTRRSAYIFPKYVLGIPTDQMIDPRVNKLPFPLQVNIARAAIFLAQGDQESFGVKKPDHAIHQAHPTISDELLHLVGHGRIVMKPNVAQLEGEEVRFVDGSREPFDVVIYCTGYRITFPFFDRDVIDPVGNEVRLFHRVVHPDHDSLYFIGLIQPLGAIMPLAELQSHWVAGLLEGEMALPSKRKMDREIDAYQRETRERYVSSPRHTIQVDFHPYIEELKAAMRRGRRRARRRGLLGRFET